MLKNKTTVVNTGYALLRGFQMEQLWPNTTSCFDLSTNFTFIHYSAFTQSFWLPVWSFYDRIELATKAINKTSFGAHTCLAAGTNIGNFWQNQFIEYEAYDKKYAVLSLSFVQNIFNQLLNFRHVYQDIQTSKNDTLSLVFYSARMVRMLTVFPLYISQEMYDPATIYNPNAWYMPVYDQNLRLAKS